MNASLCFLFLSIRLFFIQATVSLANDMYTRVASLATDGARCGVMICYLTVRRCVVYRIYSATAARQLISITQAYPAAAAAEDQPRGRQHVDAR